jgi:predicted KAP-like P-loop ATPase
LLRPFLTSLWWHHRKKSFLFNKDQDLPLESSTFLQKLFSAILDSIFYDTQNEASIKNAHNDEMVSSLFDGFLLQDQLHR